MASCYEKLHCCTGQTSAKLLVEGVSPRPQKSGDFLSRRIFVIILRCSRSYAFHEDYNESGFVATKADFCKCLCRVVLSGCRQTESVFLLGDGM